MKGEEKHCRQPGRFLVHQRRKQPPCRCWLMITMLLAWDGMLIYMIARCMIVPAYGAAFVAVISIYLGYQL